MLRAPRAARAAANGRLQGGLGAVPRRESGPLDFRVRQAAFDVMTRVRSSVADRELHLDWALGAMNVPAILKAITDFEGTPAGECAAARARVTAPQMGGHERRAAVAARARSRPEASPSAPRAMAASSPPLAASTTSMPSGAAAATVTDVRLQCFTGASWLLGSVPAQEPHPCCAISNVCATRRHGRGDTNVAERQSKPGSRSQSTRLTRRDCPSNTEREKTTAASKRSDNRPSPTKAPAPAPALRSRFWQMEEADGLYGARTTSADSGAAAAGTATRA